MDRRNFLIATTLAGAAGLRPGWSEAVSSDRRLPLQEAAAEAWLYGLMLIENAQARQKMLTLGRPNQLAHRQGLLTPAARTVTTPNNDTLYSVAWIDLSAGPVSLTMPEVGERYVSYQFMDMYGNNFAVLGSRTTGGGAGTLTIIGPNDASRDPLALRSPTRWVWLLVRLLIDGPGDLAAASGIQKGMSIAGPAVPRPPRLAQRIDPWPEYFSSVQALLAENPPPIADLAFFKRVEALGLGPTKGFDPGRFSAAEGKAIEAGVAAARAWLSAAEEMGRIAGGWLYPKSTLGDFGQDYRYRAYIALTALAALPPQEAMYMRPVATDGAYDLPSAANWRLSFEADQLPPVDAFWSLTMYERTDDGQYFFFDNRLDRYSIGDRTPGIRRRADGSFDIWISRNDPGGERTANWLPAPRTEKFSIMLRAYLPRPELLEGRYLLPPLKRE
ncbi:MAG TPA: DUF1254 domain-containing protein [Povalibacter sp.]